MAVNQCPAIVTFRDAQAGAPIIMGGAARRPAVAVPAGVRECREYPIRGGRHRASLPLSRATRYAASDSGR